MQNIGMYTVCHIAQRTGGRLFIYGIDGIMNKSAIHQPSVAPNHKADNIRQTGCRHCIGHADRFGKLGHNTCKQKIDSRFSHCTNRRIMKLHRLFYGKMIATIISITATTCQTTDINRWKGRCAQLQKKTDIIGNDTPIPISRNSNIFDICPAGGCHQHQRQIVTGGNIDVLLVKTCQRITMSIVINQSGMNKMFVQRDMKFIA